jgi:hypothetical protein
MKRKINYLLIVLLLGFVVACCPRCTDDKNNSNQVLAEKQEQLMQEANRQVGMPAIKNFQERKLLKMILELRDQENIVNYAYLWNEYNGKLVYIGKCIGYGIPYATEFTNPSALQRCSHGSGSGWDWRVLPQADPNGLFMPAAAEGTWLMLIDPADNSPHPVYIEPRVIVSPFKLIP